MWGPFGTHRERAYTLSAHVQSADGSWMTKELPGAQSWEDWGVAWDFASVCWAMAGIIERGVADTYRDYVKNLAQTYPHAWWVACQADWEIRFEWAVHEYRRQREFHGESPGASFYDPVRPWNSVLLATFHGG